MSPDEISAVAKAAETDTVLRLERQVDRLKAELAEEHEHTHALITRIDRLTARAAELEEENAALTAFTGDESVRAFIREMARKQVDRLLDTVRRLIVAERPDLAPLLETLDRALAERRAERDAENGA